MMRKNTISQMMYGIFRFFSIVCAISTLVLLIVILCFRLYFVSCLDQAFLYADNEKINVSKRQYESYIEESNLIALKLLESLSDIHDSQSAERAQCKIRLLGKQLVDLYNLKIASLYTLPPSPALYCRPFYIDGGDIQSIEDKSLTLSNNTILKLNVEYKRLLKNNFYNNLSIKNMLGVWFFSSTSNPHITYHGKYANLLNRLERIPSWYPSYKAARFLASSIRKYESASTWISVSEASNLFNCGQLILNKAMKKNLEEFICDNSPYASISYIYKDYKCFRNVEKWENITSNRFIDVQLLDHALNTATYKNSLTNMFSCDWLVTNPLSPFIPDLYMHNDKAGVPILEPILSPSCRFSNIINANVPLEYDVSIENQPIYALLGKTYQEITNHFPNAIQIEDNDFPQVAKNWLPPKNTHIFALVFKLRSPCISEYLLLMFNKENKCYELLFLNANGPYLNNT